MRFTVSGIRKIYNLGPARPPMDDHGRILRDVPMLSISSGNGRTLDTDQPGWSPEEKMAMERHLLSHHLFGTKRLVDRGEQRGDMLLNSQVWELWFAPDQDIPAEHLEFCKQQNWYKAWNMDSVKAPEAASSGRPCLHTVTDGSSVMKCAEAAIGDGMYCSEHALVEAVV